MCSCMTLKTNENSMRFCSVVHASRQFVSREEEENSRSGLSVIDRQSFLHREQHAKCITKEHVTDVGMHFSTEANECLATPEATFPQGGKAKSFLFFFCCEISLKRCRQRFSLATILSCLKKEREREREREEKREREIKSE